MRTTPQNIERFAEFADCGRVVVFDTETTGGSCSDEICQLAAAEYINGRLEFFDFLGSDVLLVAHNNRFDLKMLQQECAKFDCAFEPEGVEMCDTLALARYFRPDLKSHALGNLLEPLGVDGVNSHDALDDVMACAGVFFKLIAERSVKKRCDLLRVTSCLQTAAVLKQGSCGIG